MSTVPAHHVNATRTDKWLACLDQDTSPRFQSLKLLDLPVEVLENVVRQCDGSLLPLSATCRTLRDVALADAYTVWSYESVNMTLL